MTTTRSSTPKAAGLPHELTEFLLELALTVQRYAMYPGGHPSVDAAVAALVARLDGLLEQRAAISLGVARRQVIVEGVATDATHPVLRALAERLHRHRLGAVALRRGLGAAELRSALAAVAADPERTGEPLGSLPPERLASWPHVGFYRVTYEQLQLTVSELADDSGDADGGPTGQLWVGLAQAALARGDGTDAPPVAVAAAADAGEVARAINEHPAARGYDQMIVGYMLQLAQALRQGGDGGTVVRRRLSQMIRELDPTTLRRLLSMGGDMAQRAQFLHDAADTLRPDAVLELVRAAAATEGQDISTSMLRMLTKLATFAESAAAPGSERAVARLREQVRELLEGWSLEDPNPDAYTQALESMSRHAATDDDVASSPNAAEPLRVVQMGIEVEAAGTSFWRALDALIAAGQLADVVELVDGAGGGNDVVDALWRRLESADHVRRVLTTDPVDFESLDRILARLPAGTVISLLLDRISESASRATRMGVFQRLTARGFAAVPHVLERLRDERWFVQRNMLALLGEIGSWPAHFSALHYARNPKSSVRREALQLAVRTAAEREQAICLALVDADDRAARIGVNAAREHGLPARAVDAVLRRLDEPGLAPDLRAALIRLLGRHATPAVVARLVTSVLVERRLRGPKLLPTSPELIAAVATLADMQTADARARTALTLAAAADDAAVRAAAAGSDA